MGILASSEATLVLNMTNEEILTEAIKKAIKNGWKDEYGVKLTSFKEYKHGFFSINRKKGYPHLFSPIDIFSHSFAKAFWGNQDFGDEGLAWQYHLQRMVLEEDPITYLEKFL